MYEEDFEDSEKVCGEGAGSVGSRKNVGRVYYRWKSAEDHEWVRMTGKEYYEFVRSEEGKKHFFVEDEDPDHETDTIVHEAAQAEFREWDSEREREWQLRRDIRDAASGEKVRTHRRKRPLVCCLVSFDSETGNGDEDLPLSDRIADPDSLFEDGLIERSLIRESMKRLEPEEEAVIAALFFNNPEGLSERKVADRMRIPQKTFNDRKKAAFRKIKLFCGIAAQTT